MTEVRPFRAYRYTPRAGRLDDLVTQPYDKITREMQAAYLERSPYNLVRIVLGPRSEQDSPDDNVYTRAARYFQEWLQAGILAQDPEPAFYVYSQEFTLPESSERLTRVGFIGLGPVVDYSQGIVFRHERTLNEPKRDRLELLHHTRAHFESIFVLYPDPDCTVERVLQRFLEQPPLASAVDEYGTLNRIWRVVDPEACRAIQQAMRDKKLLIADGHHRYETALAFAKEHPELDAARFAMMTFVNLYSPGLRILATHRVLRGRAPSSIDALRKAISGLGRLRWGLRLEELRSLLERPDSELVRIGLTWWDQQGLGLLEAPRSGDQLDLEFLHNQILAGLLGLNEQLVAEAQPIEYVRGIAEAIELVRSGAAWAAFLLPPVGVDDVARIAFKGGLMPQKSTDFYPKLLSGLTIYRLES